MKFKTLEDIRGNLNRELRKYKNVRPRWLFYLVFSMAACTGAVTALVFLAVYYAWKYAWPLVGLVAYFYVIENIT